MASSSRSVPWRQGRFLPGEALQSLPDEAERNAIEASKSILSAFKNKCCGDGVHWKWIELADCEVLADTAMTVAQASFLKKWQADYISFRSDPPQDMLREI